MDQLTIFDMLYENYKIKKKLRIIELFGGIGAQAKAIERLAAKGKIPLGFEHYKLVEFDKYAIKSYNAIHNTNFEPLDIRDVHAKDLEIVDRDKYDYLLTYSFPCQDISNAGHQKGFSKGSGTRSGLLWEVERILNECGDGLPQILLCENVPLLISEKNKKDLQEWISFLEHKGFSNYYKLLNSKNFGIPQNRNRFFMISILGEWNYHWPKTIPLKLILKDMLEEDVDEKYYLSQKMIDCFMSDGTGDYPRRERFLQNIGRENQDVGNSITTLAGNRATDNFVVEDIPNQRLRETIKENEIKDGDFIDTYNRSVKDGIAGTITTRTDPSNNTFIAIKNATKQGYLLGKDGDGVDISGRMETHRGTVQKGMSQTIKTQCDVGVIVGTYQFAKSDQFMQGKDRFQEGKDIADTLQTSQKEDVVVKVGNYSPSGHNASAIVDSKGIAPTVMENHGTVTAIIVNDIIENNNKNAKHQQDLLQSENDVCRTIPAGTHGSTPHLLKTIVSLEQKTELYTDLEKSLFTEDGNIKRYVDSDVVDEFKEGQMATTSYPQGYGHGTRVHNESITLTANERPSVKYDLRIRKLTSRECFRLMGFDDVDFDKASKVNSNAQLYKQAGNSIVVNVLEAIFRQLL